MAKSSSKEETNTKNLDSKIKITFGLFDKEGPEGEINFPPKNARDINYLFDEIEIDYIEIRAEDNKAEREEDYTIEIDSKKRKNS